MATSAAIGHGTIIAVGDGASPENFTTISEVTSVSPPGTQIDMIDATHMESPDRYREYITGLKDGTDGSIEMNFVPGGAGQLAMAELLGATDPTNFKITWPNAHVEYFQGYVTGFQPTAPVDDKMTATATIKQTGPYHYSGSPF
jgi:hypothetical protein